MKEFELILKEIAEKQCDDFLFLKDNRYRKFVDRCWQAIRKSETEALTTLSSALGDEKFERLKEYIIKQNEDYYIWDYFRNETLDPEVRKALLNKIYLNGIIASDYEVLLDSVRDKVPKTQLNKILNTLQSITYFCASYNRKGKNLAGILKDMYDLDVRLCGDIEKMYDENRISLKLDYLIFVMEKAEKKI